MTVATYYVDWNRGNDLNSGLSSALPFKSLSMVSGRNLAAGSAILLASDSHWTVEHSASVSNKVMLHQFNGSAAARNYIGPYDPAGVTGTRPTITHRMVPTSADWTWDAVKAAWYVQLSISAFLTRDCWVKVAGEYAETTNQDDEDINATHNGMTTDRLRFNADRTNNRFYMAYDGDSSLVDPSAYFGPGQIVIGLSSIFGAYNGCQHTTMEGIHFEGGGGGLYLYVAGADYEHRGFEMVDCSARDTNSLLSYGTYDLNASTGIAEIQMHGCTTEDIAGWSFTTYGNSLDGDVYGNRFYRNNKCHALGGSIYTQNKRNDAIATELRVRHNFATDVRNGTGNCSFDGCGFYADNYDDGTLFFGNIVTNCFKAYQTNNGRRSTFVGNLAYNCDTLISATDASQNNASDYLIANNAIIGATGNIRPHGDTITAIQPIGAWRDGTGMVKATIVNNIIIGSGAFSLTRMGILAYNEADWVAGKVDVRNNFITGTSAELVKSNAADKTAVSACLAGEASFVNKAGNDYRIRPSAWETAGVDIYYKGCTDPNEQAFQHPASVGAYARLTKSSWF